MVASVSFTKRVPPSAAGAGTLKALMERQKLAALAREQATGPAETPTIMQGLGHLAQVASAGIREGRADRQESTARAELAKMVAGIEPGQASAQQLADIGMYDPDLANQYRQEMLDARKAAADAAQQELEYKRGRTDSQSDWERTQTDQIADEARARAEEAARDARENEQAIGAEGRAEGRTIGAENRAAAAAAAEHERAIREGKVAGLSPEQKAALNLPPDTDFIGNAVGTDLTAITKPKTSQSRPGTPEERAAYNIPENQPFRMVSEDSVNWKPEAIGSGIPLSSEASARLAVGKEFTDQSAQLLKEIEQGEITGLYDVAAGWLGSGRQGEITRAIEQGTDAMILHLTGAGKNAQEAKDYVRRYLPAIQNSAGDVASKVKALDSALRSIHTGIVTHDFDAWKAEKDAAAAGAPTEPPVAAAAPAEAPPTEEDIQETMRANNMTRQQVLDALAKRAGRTTNGRP